MLLDTLTYLTSSVHNVFLVVPFSWKKNISNTDSSEIGVCYPMPWHQSEIFFIFEVVSEWDSLLNVTCNDISVRYVTAFRCAGGLKKKLNLRSDSQRYRQTQIQNERWIPNQRILWINCSLRHNITTELHPANWLLVLAHTLLYKHTILNFHGVLKGVQMSYTLFVDTDFHWLGFAFHSLS